MAKATKIASTSPVKAPISPSKENIISGVGEEDNTNSSLNRGMDMDEAMQLVDSFKQNILL